MADRSVCTPLFAESDAQNNTTSTPHAASVTDADTVINTKIDSSQVEGDRSEEELLKGLLTDDYCHVCDAVLLFESQRLSHYEGKKHAQKLRVYLQSKRQERMKKDSTGAQPMMMTDKDYFCELCHMVFSAPVVARSHYEGKVHLKNLRKQHLQPPPIDRLTEVRTLPSQDPDHVDQKSAPEGRGEHLLDSATPTTTPSREVDLKDPQKYCVLCDATFNNPQMALQHYNGRKHQRKQTRCELLKELGDDVQPANSLMCQMCGIQFNSVEMYQAHMQGNKHQVREKKVIELCNSQQKVYNTFADELSDYIQIQKARGINSRSQVVSPGDAQKEEEEENKEEVVLAKGDITELSKPMPVFPPTYNHPHQPHPGYNPVEGWRPPFQGPSWPPHALDHNCPPPVQPGPGSPLFNTRPVKRRHRKQSSSSSYSTSSSYSSSLSSSDSSSSTSESEGTKHRRREKRRIRRTKREKDKRARNEDSDKEDKRTKGRRSDRDKDSEERRRGESGESKDERKRKKHGKQRWREKKSRAEDLKPVGGDRVTDSLTPEDTLDSKRETEVHIEAEMNVEQGYGGQDSPSKPKDRKDKKKMKEKADTRTEEEKLWDDSILGF